MKITFEAIDSTALKLQILDFTKTFFPQPVAPVAPVTPVRTETRGRKQGESFAALRGTDPLDKAAQEEVGLPIPERNEDKAPALPEIKTDGFPQPTKEELLVTLKKVNDVVGLQAVKEVLAKAGVERVTGLKQEQWGSVYLDALTLLKTASK